MGCTPRENRFRPFWKPSPVTLAAPLSARKNACDRQTATAVSSRGSACSTVNRCGGSLTCLGLGWVRVRFTHISSFACSTCLNLNLNSRDRSCRASELDVSTTPRGSERSSRFLRQREPQQRSVRQCTTRDRGSEEHRAAEEAPWGCLAGRGNRSSSLPQQRLNHPPPLVTVLGCRVTGQFPRRCVRELPRTQPPPTSSPDDLYTSALSGHLQRSETPRASGSPFSVQTAWTGLYKRWREGGVADV